MNVLQTIVAMARYAQRRVELPQGVPILEPEPIDLSPRAPARRLVPRRDAGMSVVSPLPAKGRITSRFGWRDHPILHTRRLHAGVDIGARRGSPVVAVAAGKVVSAGPRRGYGLTVVLDHGAGEQTLYAHMDSLAVVAGQLVAAAATLGTVGATGRVTGAHLHFERRLNGVPVDPAV